MAGKSFRVGSILFCEWRNKMIILGGILYLILSIILVILYRGIALILVTLGSYIFGTEGFMGLILGVSLIIGYGTPREKSDIFYADYKCGWIFDVIGICLAIQGLAELVMLHTPLKEILFPSPFR